MVLWQLPACHPATIGYAKIGSSRKAKLPFLHSRDGLLKGYCWLTIPLMRPFRGIRGGDPSEFQDAEGCCQVNPSQRSAIDGLKFALEKIQASSWRVKCSDCDPWEGWGMVVFLYLQQPYFCQWMITCSWKSVQCILPLFPRISPTCLSHSFGMSPFFPS